VGQVYDIPYSALIATLLLKNGVVSFDEINEFSNVISSWGCNYNVIDDEYISNKLPYYIDDFVGIFLVRGDNFYRFRNGWDYDSRVGNLIVRQILERMALYPGNILLDYIKYQKVADEKISFIDYNQTRDVFVKVKSKIYSLKYRNSKLKIGV